MNTVLKDKLIEMWSKYFGEAELPITFYYSEEDGGAEKAFKPEGWSCLICELAKVRKGRSLCYNEDAVKCLGAKRFLGYTTQIRPGFEYFLSCGNDTVEGERYMQTPEMVKEWISNQPLVSAGGRNIIFKRWDKLNEEDHPEVVIFFAKPDILSGLFTLTRFDRTDQDAVICPFSSGCSSIVYLPYLESMSGKQRAVIGMFDPSARRCVPADVLSFAVPYKRFEQMAARMEESFLITKTWATVRERINKT
jgi:uncharacterized protein (DUF169 family)